MKRLENAREELEFDVVDHRELFSVLVHEMRQ